LGEPAYVAVYLPILYGSASRSTPNKGSSKAYA
jgi:hypothetical protein